jgi:hypothetical protein
MSATLAHVGGVPIEETLGSLGPALLVGLGVAWANLRARLRRARSRPSGGRLSLAQEGGRAMDRTRRTRTRPQDAVSTLSRPAPDTGEGAGRWL